MSSTAVDPANTLLTPGPSVMSTSRTRLPDGTQLLVLTVRTSSATVTVFLTREEGTAWADQLRAEAGKVSGIVAANGRGTPQ